jgi:hypothetical protein
MTKRDEALLGISATTFLILCIWLGPKVAVLLIFVVAIVTLWFLACRRWPIVAVFTLASCADCLAGGAKPQVSKVAAASPFRRKVFAPPAARRSPALSGSRCKLPRRRQRRARRSTSWSGEG